MSNSACVRLLTPEKQPSRRRQRQISSSCSKNKATLLQQILLILATCSFLSVNARVVTYQYVQDSGLCEVLTGDYWDVEMGDFYIDCGNANQGCMPGHNIMIDGDFTANSQFQTIADLDVKLCIYNGLVCTPHLWESEINVCRQLDLEDEYGVDACNEPGNYTLEANFTLPHHEWWEDLAFDGFTFTMYLTLDKDLQCQGQFVTRVYYGQEKWMAVAVSSLLLTMGFSYYLSRRCCTAAEEVAEEEIKADLLEDGIIILKSSTEIERTMEDRRKERALHRARDIVGGDAIIMRKSSADIESTMEDKRKERAVKRACDILGDDDSVTTTSYLPMLDFSSSAVRHADRMAQVRQAHFERLQVARESRRPNKSDLIMKQLRGASKR